MEKEDILNEIKKSKKYKSLTDEVITNEIENFCKRFPKWKEYKLKFITREVKKELHKAYGSFQTYKKARREKLFEEFLKNNKDLSSLKKILETNLSTRERLKSYGKVYEKIFELVGKPNSILDLGSGLNPLSFPYMKIDKDVRYYAYDINKEDISMIQKFFHVLGINGHAETLDLKNVDNIKKLPSADLCFMFKVIDPLEKNEKGHKLAEEIIMILSEKCKYIVSSFATKTLSGKKMNFPARGWFERMLKRRGFKYSNFSTDNEIYYIISS